MGGSSAFTHSWSRHSILRSHRTIRQLTSLITPSRRWPKESTHIYGLCKRSWPTREYPSVFQFIVKLVICSHHEDRPWRLDQVLSLARPIGADFLCVIGASCVRIKRRIAKGGFAIDCASVSASSPHNPGGRELQQARHGTSFQTPTADKKSSAASSDTTFRMVSPFFIF